MADVHYIKHCLDGALQDDNPKRLLCFVRMRDYMLQASSNDIQTTVESIIQRFKREGSKNPRIAHWLLNILQMCAVHCTETFLEELNDGDILRPFRRALCAEKYMKHYDEVVRLKLFTLLKSWHEKYQEFLPDSEFTKTYEMVVCGSKQTRLQPLNLHWFPNRNIINQTLDSFTYDLGKVGEELLDCGNKSFEDLKLLCADPKRHNLNHAEADTQDLLNTARITLTQMEANVRFWEDIVQHADIDDKSLEAIGASGYMLRKLKYDVEQIIENIKKKNLFYSVPYDIKSLGRDLLEHSNSYLHNLNVFLADHDHANFVEDPQTRTHMTLKLIEGDLLFWEESLQDILTTGDNFRKMKSEVEQISEKLKTSETPVFRPGNQSADPQGDALPLEGGNHNLDHQFAQPSKIEPKGSSASDNSVSHSTQPNGHQEANSGAQNWLCPICRIGFEKKQNYITHFSSKEHKRNIKKLPPLPTDANNSGD